MFISRLEHAWRSFACLGRTQLLQGAHGVKSTGCSKRIGGSDVLYADGTGTSLRRFATAAPVNVRDHLIYIICLKTFVRFI